jgi:hypothetical protein
MSAREQGRRTRSVTLGSLLTAALGPFLTAALGPFLTAALGPFLTAALGCAGVDPPPAASDTPATTPTPAADTSPPPSAPAASTTKTELEEAWARVDALLHHVVGWSRRHPLLDALDERALGRKRSAKRRLSYRHGVTDFVPDPDCDPERAKCSSVPAWGKDGGLYLELRAHHDAHAAGAFDATYSIGPLMLEVRLEASDPGLRTALLRELAILAGEPEPPPAGCASIVEQATAWVRDEQRGRGIAGADEIRVELAQLEPARDLIDLDADGTPELVLVFLDTGRNADHFLYAERDGCPLRLVGVVNLWSVAGIACRRVPERPLCDLHVNQLMIHGDQQASTWQFDGTRYVEASH